MIILQEITRLNWYECTKLQVTDEQKKIFTAPVVYWLAESKYETQFNPVAVYFDNTLIGFAIYIVNDNGIGEVEAMMIDRYYQGNGYGRAAMNQLISLLKEKYLCKEIQLSHRSNNKIASNLYESLGFKVIDTDGSITRSLILGGIQ